MFTVKMESAEGAKPISPELSPRTSNGAEGSTSAASSPSKLPTEFAFSSGNPSVVHGKVHIFRPITTGTAPGAEKVSSSRQVCILQVPNGMGVPEFCQFVGAYLPKVVELRFLQSEGDDGRNALMALLLFNSEATAADFIDVYDRRRFNSLEPEVCRAVLVANVEITSVDTEAAAPPPGQAELPNCPVCLERLDEHISGIVTTVCQHNFHTDCLAKWKDSSCPVCRYCQEEREHSSCMVCTCEEGLWICLICGFVGCGRYENKHSVEHWQETQHCYSLELATQRVWDYVGDNYVHRLIQSTTDGKFVELPGPRTERRSRGGGGACGSGGEGSEEEEDDMEKAMLTSKIEAVAFEYNHLLTSQLESQRMYFEALLKRASEDAERARAAEAQMGAALREAEEAARSEAMQNKELERRKAQLEDKLAAAQAGKEAACKERDFLKSLSDTLIGNQKEWQSKVGAAEATAKAREDEAVDLREQVRDLMVFLEAQSTLKNAEDGGELAEGTVLGVSASPEVQRRRAVRIKRDEGRE